MGEYLGSSADVEGEAWGVAGEAGTPERDRECRLAMAVGLPPPRG